MDSTYAPIPIHFIEISKTLIICSQYGVIGSPPVRVIAPHHTLQLGTPVRAIEAPYALKAPPLYALMGGRTIIEGLSVIDGINEGSNTDGQFPTGFAGQSPPRGPPGGSVQGGVGASPTPTLGPPDR